MIDLSRSYPIEPHPTWDVHDSSKIQTYIECPRKYFYQYVLGWRTEEASVHLVFGAAMHEALEIVLHGMHFGREKDGASGYMSEAFAKFEEVYRKDFPDELTDETRFPKVPLVAYGTLEEYAITYENDTLRLVEDENGHPLTEIAGTIPISNNRVVHFRLDAIVRDNDGYIRCLEHKTASRYTDGWHNQWSLSIQTGLYTHALYCLFDPESVKGIMINGMIIKKPTVKQVESGRFSATDFIRVPVDRTYDMIAAWLSTTNNWMDRIEEDFERLHRASTEDQVLDCFHHAPPSCNKWAGCPFLDHCAVWANPLRRADAPPMGYTTNWWDPREREDSASQVIHLERS